MLDHQKQKMPIKSDLTCDKLTEMKSLPKQSSLLYEYLSMESPNHALVTPSRLEEDQLAESLVHVTLAIPIAVWSGCSELTISLPTQELSSGTQEDG